MKFFDWLFTSVDNHDLFELRIEGKDWIKIGTDKFAIPSTVNPRTAYNFPGHEMTWTSVYNRFPANADPVVLQQLKYWSNETTVYVRPDTGFSYSGDAVKTELANPDLLKRDKYIPYDCGMIADPVNSIKAMEAKARSNKKLQNDMTKIKADLQKQLETFLSQKYGNRS